MQAVYLQSVRSPYQRSVTRYQHNRAMSRDHNVYSQPCDTEDDDDDDYINDSFCVDNDVDDTQGKC